MPVATSDACASGYLYLPTGDSDSTMGNYLDNNSRSLRRRERRPSYAHTAAPVLGPRAVTPGVAATTGPSVDVCLLLRALQRRRIESLVLGALSSSPVHRALVHGIGDQHSGIVRRPLLDCLKSSRDTRVRPSSKRY